MTVGATRMISQPLFSIPLCPSACRRASPNPNPVHSDTLSSHPEYQPGDRRLTEPLFLDLSVSRLLSKFKHRSDGGFGFRPFFTLGDKYLSSVYFSSLGPSCTCSDSHNCIVNVYSLSRYNRLRRVISGQLPVFFSVPPNKFWSWLFSFLISVIQNVSRRSFQLQNPEVDVCAFPRFTLVYVSIS